MVVFFIMAGREHAQTRSGCFAGLTRLCWAAKRILPPLLGPGDKSGVKAHGGYEDQQEEENCKK